MSVPPPEVLPAIRSAPQTARELSKDVIQALRGLRYEAYLQTPWWRARRNRALRAAGYRCTACGTKRELQVHHRSYERLGEEQDEDLQVLCRGCHLGEHYEEVQSHVAFYVRVLSEVVSEGGREAMSDVVEEAKARCAARKVPYHHAQFHAAVSRVLPRMPFTPPRGKEELYHVGRPHEPLSRAEAAGILASLQVQGLMRHMPEVRPLTVREIERRRALYLVAQAIRDQVAQCEAAEQATDRLRGDRSE